VACVTASALCQLAWLVTGRVVFLLPMVAALRWTALVQHNHSHLTLFRRGRANRLLELALGTVTGMPMEMYREAHTRTHHRHTGTPQDWTQPTEVRGGEAVLSRPLTRGRNACVFVPRAWVLGWSAVRRDPAQTRNVMAEGAVMAAVIALPVVLGSPTRLLAVALLWVVVALVSADANYKHHDGYLAADEPTSFANDSFSPLHTTLGFNIGYHAAHHRRPNAHWTKLPELSKTGITAGARREPF
jgi:fatty acid desaturase